MDISRIASAAHISRYNAYRGGRKHRLQDRSLPRDNKSLLLFLLKFLEKNEGDESIQKEKKDRLKQQFDAEFDSTNAKYNEMKEEYEKQSKVGIFFSKMSASFIRKLQ